SISTPTGSTRSTARACPATSTASCGRGGAGATRSSGTRSDGCSSRARRGSSARSAGTRTGSSKQSWARWTRSPEKSPDERQGNTMELRFRHDDSVYTFDNSLSLPEAMLVKECTGLTAGQFLTGIGQMDGAALAAMVLLAKMRAGEDTTWSDLQSMDIVKLIESVGELNGADEGVDEQPA